MGLGGWGGEPGLGGYTSKGGWVGSGGDRQGGGRSDKGGPGSPQGIESGRTGQLDRIALGIYWWHTSGRKGGAGLVSKRLEEGDQALFGGGAVRVRRAGQKALKGGRRRGGPGGEE